MEKCLIYYTNNQLEEPIFSIVQQQLLKSGLIVYAVSLKPIEIDSPNWVNVVLDLPPGFLTMMGQIIKALELAPSKYVFFCEHDVLYPLSHFDFTPPRDDIFYYNDNVWRWDYPKDRLITYDRLMSLSSLCVNKQFVLNHYQARMNTIIEMGWDKDTRHEPDWARKWGYEPGTKKTKRGGFNNDDYETWKSEYPIIDIRHNRTFSKPKVTLDSFKHLPINWQEATLDKMLGWNLKELFKL